MSCLTKQSSAGQLQPSAGEETSEMEPVARDRAADVDNLKETTLNPLSAERLPPEVWERIIKFSGKEECQGLIDRYTLINVSLVCKEWTKTAQRELGRCLNFVRHRFHEVDRWLRLPVSALVQPFHLHLYNIDKKHVAYILRRCTSLVELRLSYSGFQGFFNSNVLRYPALSNLRHLDIEFEFGGAFLDNPSDTVPLGLELESLRISISRSDKYANVSFPSNFVCALLSGASRTLRHLQVEWDKVGVELAMGEFWPHLPLLSNCLEQLTLAFHTGVASSMFLVLPSLRQLHTVELFCGIGSSEIQAILRAIPAGQIKHLKTIHHENLLDMVQDTPSLSELKQLRVALYYATFTRQGIQTSLAKLRSFAVGRGIDLLYGSKVEVDNWTYVNEMPTESERELIDTIVSGYENLLLPYKTKYR
ncbi:hypothetical protein T439DRAFT_329468 [Meredithblackwellia eburnea MCA 4105]